MARTGASNSEISRVMREIGRKGAVKGGKARMASLSKAERVEMGRKGMKSRWKKPKAKKA
jgi:hypothetical protein